MQHPIRPSEGSVFGFNFKFPGKHYGQIHPRIVVAVRPEAGGKYSVIALPISHKEPLLHEPRLRIPLEERVRIGLDFQEQYVYYSSVGLFQLPTGAKLIQGLGKSYIGQASEAFWREAKSRFIEHKNTGL